MKMVALPCGKECAIHGPAVKYYTSVYTFTEAFISNPDGSNESKEKAVLLQSPDIQVNSNRVQGLQVQQAPEEFTVPDSGTK